MALYEKGTLEFPKVKVIKEKYKSRAVCSLLHDLRNQLV